MTISPNVYKGFLYGLSLLSVVAAIVLQFIVSGSIDDKCDPDILLYFNPPIVAGSTLAVSVGLALLWAWSMKKHDTIRRISIFLWTASVSVGVASIGVSLGQVLAVEKYVASGTPPACLLATDANLKVYQYVSLALVTLSLVAPHAFSLDSKKNKNSSEEAEEPEEEEQLLKSKPLVFL